MKPTYGLLNRWFLKPHSASQQSCPVRPDMQCMNQLVAVVLIQYFLRWKQLLAAAGSENSPGKSRQWGGWQELGSKSGDSTPADQHFEWIFSYKQAFLLSKSELICLPCWNERGWVEGWWLLDNMYNLSCKVTWQPLCLVIVSHSMFIHVIIWLVVMNQSVHTVETVLYLYRGLLGSLRWSEDQITKCQRDYRIKESDTTVSHTATVGGNHLTWY